MKATLRIFFGKLLGISTSDSRKTIDVVQGTHKSYMKDIVEKIDKPNNPNLEQSNHTDHTDRADNTNHTNQATGLTYINNSIETSENVYIPSVRLSRLPFFLAHIATYAILYIFIRFLQMYFNSRGQMFSINEFGFTFMLFLITILLLPVYIRRSHDLGWSLKYVLIFSVFPAMIRFVLLIVPFIGLKNEMYLISLLKFMPFAGILYWILGQIQIIYISVMIFAPSIDTHNRFGKIIHTSFTLKNLYGFSIIKPSFFKFSKSVPLK